jgi:hypothetical protein
VTILSWIWAAAILTNAAAVLREWDRVFWWRWWALANLVCSVVEFAGRNPRMPLASMYYPFWLVTTPILGVLALCATAEAVPFNRMRVGVAAGLSLAASAILHLATKQPQWLTEPVEAYSALVLGFCGLMAITERDAHSRILAGYCLASTVCMYAAPEFPRTIGIAQQAVEVVVWTMWAGL